MVGVFFGRCYRLFLHSCRFKFSSWICFLPQFRVSQTTIWAVIRTVSEVNCFLQLKIIHTAIFFLLVLCMIGCWKVISWQNKLGRGQRDKVQQFMSITGARYISAPFWTSILVQFFDKFLFFTYSILHTDFILCLRAMFFFFNIFFWLIRLGLGGWVRALCGFVELFCCSGPFTGYSL